MEGLDFDLNYVMDTDNMGRFDMGLVAAKITKYVDQRFASDAKISNEGYIGLPDTRIIQYLTWGKGEIGSVFYWLFQIGQTTSRFWF